MRITAAHAISLHSYLEFSSKQILSPHNSTIRDDLILAALATALPGCYESKRFVTLLMLCMSVLYNYLLEYNQIH